MDQISLGLAIRALREKKQMSAKDLSSIVELPDYAISRIENGKVKLDFITAYKLAKALDVPMEELLEVAKKFESAQVVEKESELNELKEQLKALRAELMTKVNDM